VQGCLGPKAQRRSSTSMQAKAAAAMRTVLMSADGDLATLVVAALIFACGRALLSYRFYLVYRGWALGEFAYKPHLPGILGVALMVFAILIASSLGWLHVMAAILGGFVVSHLYVYFFRMRVEAALLGPMLAVLAMFLMPAARFWA
jgi:hypothetical protein